jgi:hypothetical protein
MFNRITHDKICDQCGRRYKALMSNSRFCSNSCRSRNWRKNKAKKKRESFRKVLDMNKYFIRYEKKLIDLRSNGIFHSEEELYNILNILIRRPDDSGLIVRVKIPDRKDIIVFDKFCLRRQIDFEDRYVVEIL